MIRIHLAYNYKAVTKDKSFRDQVNQELYEVCAQARDLAFSILPEGMDMVVSIEYNPGYGSAVGISSNSAMEHMKELALYTSIMQRVGEYIGIHAYKVHERLYDKSHTRLTEL